jgi:hypothetical protein
MTDASLLGVKGPGIFHIRCDACGLEYTRPQADRFTCPGCFGTCEREDLKHNHVAAEGCLSSPPYSNQVVRDRDIGKSTQGATQGKHAFDAYGHSEGQVGDLPEGPFDFDGETYEPQHDQVRLNAQTQRVYDFIKDGEWHTLGEISEATGDPEASVSARLRDLRKARFGGFTVDRKRDPESPGLFLYRLGVGGAVTSPPYAGGLSKEHTYADQEKREAGARREIMREKNIADPHYGNTDGQIASDDQETYWTAMRQVYNQLRLSLKPGGVAAIVVKDFIRKKERVPLCDMTAHLLEQVGFTVFLRCRCWVRREKIEYDVLGNPVTVVKEDKSFFRRLAESKGSPRIDWEEVIWARTP